MAIRRDWDATRRDLVRFLIPLAPGQLTAGVFRHPVAGWMRVPDVLRFFRVHAHYPASNSCACGMPATAGGGGTPP